MGNCLRRDQKSSWGDDDDWESLVSTHRQGEINSNIMEKDKLLGDRNEHTREVKITMSKKELEQLVEKVNQLQGFTLEQVLAKMVQDEDTFELLEVEHHRPWKPMLQSIPEVN